MNYNFYYLLPSLYTVLEIPDEEVLDDDNNVEGHRFCDPFNKKSKPSSRRFPSGVPFPLIDRCGSIRAAHAARSNAMNQDKVDADILREEMMMAQTAAQAGTAAQHDAKRFEPYLDVAFEIIAEDLDMFDYFAEYTGDDASAGDVLNAINVAGYLLTEAVVTVAQEEQGRY
eukprot:SAG11_NODE_4_length_33019_cov_28.098909_13_plen_171_part_00